MVATHWRKNPPVKKELYRNSPRFRFFQAIRLLEALHPEREAVGSNHNPEREAIRFKTRPTLDFQASEIYEIAETEDGQKELLVNFLGLTGIAGALPLHYTALLQERRRDRDHALQAFLDVFNHRLVSFFYRAWLKNHLHYGEDEKYGQPASRALFSLIGLGTPGLQKRSVIPDEILPFFAGLLARQPRSAVSLKYLLREVFQLPIKIQQFCGQWLTLAQASQSGLDSGNSGESLADGMMLGNASWHIQSKFRIIFGPLDLQQFNDLMPQGKYYQSLVDITRFAVGEELSFDIQLILKRDEVPLCILNKGSNMHPRLGRDAWLKTRPLKEDVQDIIFSVER